MVRGIHTKNSMSKKWVGAICAGFLALGANAASVNAAIAKPIVTSNFELDRPKVLKGDEGAVYVLVTLEALQAASTQEDARPALNLGLVLDRSGSMADKGKMEYLKRAAGMAVDQLGSRDYLSVVEYDDAINVLWPSARVDSSMVIKRLINGLEPRGMTNLTGGMMRGVDEVAERLAELAKAAEGDEGIHRVLLLSDGLANEGVTNPAEIASLVRKARKNGVRITALGLGEDYDEDLMQAIAENGGGHYYYIEHPDQMSRIFQEELNTLFETVARDAVLTVTRTRKTDTVEIVSFDEMLADTRQSVDLADFYGGEERVVVLRFQPDDDAFDRTGQVELGSIEFSYYDMESNRKRSVDFEVEVDVVTEHAEVDAALNKGVAVETALMETERQHRKAIDLYEKGDYDGAENAMASMAADMESQYAALGDDRLKHKFEALQVETSQMAAGAAEPAQRAGFLKKTKQRLYQAQSGKRKLYVLEEGDSGIEVERLQKALGDNGFYTGPVDGQYSENLRLAVEAFQEDQNMIIDGIAGPATMQALSLY